MIELPDLYPHQEEHKNNVGESLKRNRAVILCANTGGGKTRMSKWILGKALSAPPSPKKSGHVLFAVHRRGLVDNASNSFNEMPPLEHGVIMSQREPEWGQKLQVASIDTLLSWFCEDGVYSSTQTYDLIVFDETHSHVSKLITFLNAHNIKREELGLNDPFVIGLSATPQAKGLSDVYKEIVTGPSSQWLIDNKFLNPFRYFRATQGKLSNLVMKGDEFTSASVALAMDGLAGDLVRDWKKHAEGRATIGFFPRLAHAKEAMELLVSEGVNCEYVDGDTPDEARNSMFRRMNAGSLDYICNVGVVERGTDIPRVGCVQMCTAVGSIARWRQMIGRGSRIHPDVPDCIILDHGGNIKRHGFFEDDVQWTLDWTTRPAKEHKAKASIECPVCSAVYRGGKCNACGYEPQKKDLDAQGLTFDGRELKEVVPGGKKKDKAIRTNEQILVDALFKAGKSNKIFRQALGIAFKMAEEQGTKFRVPKRFNVAGQEYATIEYGSEDQRRMVSKTYPFTVGDYAEHNNPYLACNFE